MEGFLAAFVTQNLVPAILGIYFVFRLELQLALLKKDLGHLSKDVHAVLNSQEKRTDAIFEDVAKIKRQIAKRDRIMMRLIDYINSGHKDNPEHKDGGSEHKDGGFFNYREDDLDTL